LQGANLRFKDANITQRAKHLAMRTGRLTWV